MEAKIQETYEQKRDAIIKQILEERKKQELVFHKQRVNALLQEKIELELRLFVVNETLRQIEEYVKQNPHLQE